MILLLLALMPFTSPMEAGLWNALAGKNQPPKMPQLIRVLLVHDKPGVILEVKGKFKLYDPKDFSHVSSSFTGKRRYIQALNDGIRWGDEFPGVYQLMIVPESQATTTVVDGIEYRGSIYVYDIGGTISIVNDVYVEDYLQSILAPHYREGTSTEVLAAIAIAARTTAYYQAYNPKNTYWDVDARQVNYQGYAATNLNSPIEDAIIETRYLIMSKAGKNAVEVPFSAQWADSRITVAEAEKMASKGDHAAQILERAFPGTTLQMMYFEPAPKASVVAR